jgi:hypothetical protein
MAVACGCALPARAQLAAYGEATDASLRFQSTPHMVGGTFGLFYTKPVGLVAVGADFRGVMVKKGGTDGTNNDTKLDEGQFGIRLSAAKHVLPLSLMPYGEALVGLGYWRGGAGVFRQDQSHALFQAIAGVDVPVYKRLDWRVIEFSYGRAGAKPGFINPIAISTGLVYHFPPLPRR